MPSGTRPAASTGSATHEQDPEAAWVHRAFRNDRGVARFGEDREAQTGPVVGTTTQIWHFDGSDMTIEDSEEVTFTVKRIRGGDHPKYRVKNFRTDVQFSPFQLDCAFLIQPLDFSVRANLGVSRFRFLHTDSSKTIYPDSSYEEFEAVSGVFRSRLKAKGGFTAQFRDDQPGSDEDVSCDSDDSGGVGRWRAHHR